jgi:rhodanese-related sulfurtransferase
LRQAGYKNARPIRGGMLAWQMAHLPIVKDNGGKGVLVN